MIAETTTSPTTQTQNNKHKKKLSTPTQITIRTPMAYTREEKEQVEVDYPIEQLWTGIQTTITKLQWTTQETDKNKHHITIKTKGAFLSYPTNIKITLNPINNKTTHMLITAETPVTTITSVFDIGRTRERIEKLIITLAQHMEQKTKTNPKTNTNP